MLRDGRAKRGEKSEPGVFSERGVGDGGSLPVKVSSF
jgi:hypothetical protein